MKKRTLFMFGVGCFAMLLASCGGTSSGSITGDSNSTNPSTSSGESSNTGSSSSQGNIIKEPVTISMWIKNDPKNTKLYEEFVESFKSVEPNVTVNFSSLEDVSNYNELEEKVLVGLTAKNYPNIVQAYPGHVADYLAPKNGSIALNMDPYINNEVYGWVEEEKNNFDLSAGQQFAEDGTYCLPFNKSSEVLYYNRDKLVGLNLSTYDSSINGGRALNDSYLQNLTWEEFYEHLCPALISYDTDHPDEKLINKDNPYWSIMHYEDDSNHFITTAKQYGVPYTSITAEGKGSVDFNCVETKAHMKKIGGYSRNHYIITRWSSEGSNGYSANHILDGSALFAVNSTVGAQWFYDAANPIDIGIGHIPYAANKKRYVVEQGTSLAFLDKGNEQENLASWLFYKHMSSYSNALKYSLQSGYFPMRNDIYEDEAYINNYDPSNYDAPSSERFIAQVFAFAPELIDDYFTEAPFVGSSNARSAVSYLNSSLLKTNVELTDEYIDAQFEEAYNNAVLG